MEQKGFVTSQKEQQGGRTRKVYTMTRKGQEYIETYNTIIKEQMKSKNTK
jgi:DNA-binding PadR family transcriptional regulator